MKATVVFLTVLASASAAGAAIIETLDFTEAVLTDGFPPDIVTAGSLTWRGSGANFVSNLEFQDFQIPAGATFAVFELVLHAALPGLGGIGVGLNQFATGILTGNGINETFNGTKAIPLNGLTGEVDILIGFFTAVDFGPDEIEGTISNLRFVDDPDVPHIWYRPVPEPASVAVWGLLAILGFFAWRRCHANKTAAPV